MGEFYLLFDVGGTDVKAALATADGELLHILREPTARPEPGGDGATAVLEQLSDLADRLGGAVGTTAHRGWAARLWTGRCRGRSGVVFGQSRMA